MNPVGAVQALLCGSRYDADCKVRYFARRGDEPEQLRRRMVAERAVLAKGHVTFVVCLANGAAAWLKDSSGGGGHYDFVSEPLQVLRRSSSECVRNSLPSPGGVLWLMGSGIS